MYAEIRNVLVYNVTLFGKRGVCAASRVTEAEVMRDGRDTLLGALFGLWLER